MDTAPIISLRSTFSLNTTQAMTRVKTFSRFSSNVKIRFIFQYAYFKIANCFNFLFK